MMAAAKPKPARAGSPSKDYVGQAAKISKAASEERQSHRERVAARMKPWENSPTNAGRSRLRGGARGNPGRLRQDIETLRLGVREAAAALTFLMELETKQHTMTKAEVAAIHREGRGKAGLAGRYLDELLCRPDPR